MEKDFDETEKSAGTILAARFNHRVQTYIFTLWGRMYVIFVDEAIQWARCDSLTSKDSDSWHQ
eukprot:7402558-Pyramimonas_sp.AAC.1